MSLLFISTVFSTRTATTAIGSSGTIVATSTASPLHVDGNQIKDTNGKTVYLRGANFFLYSGDPTKIWLTNSGTVVGINDDWATQTVPAIIQNFDKMKSYNFNCFRIHTSAQNWLQSPNYVAHMQELASLAAERGIYVIFDIYCISNAYPNTCYMPYPPYSSAADVLLIPNEQAFVDLWALIANAMKNQPNVLLEVYNEPVGNYRTDSNWFQTDYNAMMNTHQKCITRIRQITDLPIIVEWGYTIGVELAGPWTWAPSVKMNVFADDPRVQGTNIIYTWHWYEGNPQRNQQPLNSVADIDTYMTFTGLTDVASRKAVLATELGGVVGNAFALTWMNNALNALIAKGIGFISWVWTAPLMTNHGDELIATGPNFVLTDKGSILTQKTLSITN